MTTTSLTMKNSSLLFAVILAAALPASGGEATSCADCDNACSAGPHAALLSTYVQISNALAADNLGDAQTAAAQLACCLTCDNRAGLTDKVQAFTKAASLAEARALFKGISAAVVPIVADAGDHFVMTCPMAKADWIQTDSSIANPYFGSSMLRCGSIKKTIKSGS